LDRPAESEPGIEVHPLAGDEVLLGARLASASARDVMDAMRALGMPRVAVSQDPAPTIVVRCSRERVEVAAQRIRSLEGAGSE